MNPENEFDFWLGEWNTAWGNDEKGANRVERILEGKIIQENFSGPDFTEISVCVYDPERQLWCQTWVDNTGTYLDFTGRSENGQMILSRAAIVPGRPASKGWSGTLSKPANLTGIGSAPTTAGRPGACLGRSFTRAGNTILF